MSFQFDPHKSETNRIKHGIDFLDARVLWLDPDRVEVPARTQDEPRFIAIGRISHRVWSAVITYRDDEVRIVSVRAARQEEVEIYESTDI